MPNGEVGQARSMAYVSSGSYSSFINRSTGAILDSNAAQMSSYYIEKCINNAIVKKGETYTKDSASFTVTSAPSSATFFDDIIPGDFSYSFTVKNSSGASKTYNKGDTILDFATIPEYATTSASNYVSKLDSKLVNITGVGSTTYSAYVGKSRTNNLPITINAYDVKTSGNVILSSTTTNISFVKSLSGDNTNKILETLETSVNKNLTPNNLTITIPAKGNILTQKTYNLSNLSSLVCYNGSAYKTADIKWVLASGNNGASSDTSLKVRLGTDDQENAGDGKLFPGVNFYQLDETFSVPCTKQKFTITEKSDSAGNVTASKTSSIYYGEPITFTRTRNNRYGIDNILLTGSNVANGLSSYSNNIDISEKTGDLVVTHTGYTMPATDLTINYTGDYYGTITFDSHYDYVVSSDKAKFVTMAGYYTDVTPTFDVSKTENKAEKITYTSSNTGIVTVDGDRFTGVKAGSATITAKTTHITEDPFTITVKDSNLLNTQTGNKLIAYETRKGLYGKNFVSIANELTLFLGDSFFDRYDRFFKDYYEKEFGGKNLFSIGISASTAAQWIYLSQDIKASYGIDYIPDRLVIHLGTNDIFDNGESATNVSNTLITMLRRLHEDLEGIQIYWYSIEPRIGQSTTTVTSVNSTLKTFATSNSSWLTYLNSYDGFNSHLVEGTGYYSDTVHPNATGYSHMFGLLPFTPTENPATNAILSDIAPSGTTWNATKTKIGGAYGSNFAFATSITIKAINTTNAHIGFSFNGSDNNRILIWDKYNSGNLYLGGLFSDIGLGEKLSANYLNYDTNRHIQFALLVNGNNKYIFINNYLKAVINTAFDINSLYVAFENCVVTFSGNSVGKADSYTYNFYNSKISTTYASGYTDLLGNAPTEPSGGGSNYRPNNNGSLTLASGQQYWYAYNFGGGFNMSIFSAKLRISTSESATANKYIAFNLTTTKTNITDAENSPGSGDNRFLLWDTVDSDKLFNFGGTYGGSSHISSSVNTYDPTSEQCLSVAVFTTQKHSYFILNGKVERVLTNVASSPVPNIFQIFAEGCTATFTNVYYALAGTDLYNNFAAFPDIYHYENNSYSNELLDVGNSKLESFSLPGNQGLGCAVNNAVEIISGDSSFTFYTQIYFGSLRRFGHVSFNFNGSDDNRFLLWAKDGDKDIYYAYETGGKITATSSFYYGGTLHYFTIRIEVNGTSAKMYLGSEATPKAEFTSSATITSMSLGVEDCAVTFFGLYYV